MVRSTQRREILAAARQRQRFRKEGTESVAVTSRPARACNRARVRRQRRLLGRARRIEHVAAGGSTNSASLVRSNR